MQFVDASMVAQLVKNEIVKKATWGFPGRGMYSSPPGTPTGDLFIQDKVDQLKMRLPLKAISSALLDRPTMTKSNSDLILYNPPPGTGAEPSTVKGIGLNLSTTQYGMNSIGANLQISTSSLGTENVEQIMVEFEQALAQILWRFFSVALIYGGTYGPLTSPTATNWYYYENSPANSPWNQAAAFSGLLQTAGSPISPSVDGWSRTGYTEILAGPLTLTALDGFLSRFRSANNGNVDYLVMNSAMRDYYLSLWHGAPSPQHPQYVMDQMNGRYIVAHCGIPILVNDYIVVHDPNDPFKYIYSQSNPENLSSPTGVESSIYALVLGEDKGGLFGIYPASFGSSPLKIERLVSSQTKDTVQLQGSIQFGLASKTNSSVGRLCGIQFP